MRRFSFLMVLLSIVFWITSGFLIPLGEDFPNCVAGATDIYLGEVGALSINGASGCYWAFNYSAAISDFWSERPDGDCCMWGAGMPVFFWQQPTSFSFGVNRNGIGWEYPYWLMIAVWMVAAFKEGWGMNYGVRDMLVLATVLALTAAAIKLRVAIFLTVFLNLATVALVVFWAWRVFRRATRIRPPTADSVEPVGFISKPSG